MNISAQLRYFMNELCCHFKLDCRLLISNLSLSAHQTDTRLSCTIQILFAFICFYTIKLCTKQPRFPATLGIINIIHLDKRLSSNSVYQCQPHSPNLFTLQIWQQSLASRAYLKTTCMRIKQSKIVCKTFTCCFL